MCVCLCLSVCLCKFVKIYVQSHMKEIQDYFYSVTFSERPFLRIYSLGHLSLKQCSYH